MYGSHYGLKGKYEASCDELELLIELAKEVEGVLGARMMGGGFGGCTINLIQKNAVEKFQTHILKNYKTPENTEPEIIVVKIENGV